MVGRAEMHKNIYIRIKGALCWSTASDIWGPSHETHKLTASRGQVVKRKWRNGVWPVDSLWFRHSSQKGILNSFPVPVYRGCMCVCVMFVVAASCLLLFKFEWSDNMCRTFYWCEGNPEFMRNNCIMVVRRNQFIYVWGYEWHAI